jgi:hypothetical protein
MITLLALDGLPPQAPAWLRDSAARERVAYQSVEPDRWRATTTHPMGHENAPEHYLDIEDLEPFGLTLETMPPLRYDYVRELAHAKQRHPDRIPPYDPSKDRDRSKEWPGFLPHAICEHYVKLQSSFRTVRLLEAAGDRVRPEELEMARANVLYHAGILSHFVGDAAQPLHTTCHFNGWSGDNPKGYTTARTFHAFVDGGLLDVHAVTYESLRGAVEFTRGVDAGAPWNDVIEHLRRSFRQVEPLYRMEKDGSLRDKAGKEWLTARLADGASMLSAMYWAAYTSSAPSGDVIREFVRRNYPPSEGAGEK